MLEKINYQKCLVSSMLQRTTDKYGLCPLFEIPLLTMKKCKTDIECSGHAKCCETLRGNYCMPTDSQRIVCPGGKMSVGICGNNLQCPSSYHCLNEICCPFEKAGDCPLMIIPENFALENFDSCENDYECIGIRKCCPTLLGLRCLLPEAKAVASTLRYSKSTRRFSYQPFYRKRTVIHEKELIDDSNFAHTRGKEAYFESGYYYDVDNEDGNG
ncbi:hypothetical protein M514_05078 [Trichuris suis]|uniref:WAP domain-containing protein n=1 Tax=Trichuris suis TaxID=68888 RepID=A0A085NCR5_9BILA|nr:hypothetical protein M513_05078 [Trichuris suis]KFD67261.1 hypothetical protein M514_05078 [Trichuris suis]